MWGSKIDIIMNINLILSTFSVLYYQNLVFLNEQITLKCILSTQFNRIPPPFSLGSPNPAVSGAKDYIKWLQPALAECS